MDYVILMSNVVLEILKIPLLTGIVVVQLGFYYYKRQKELEDVRRIYIMECLEEIQRRITEGYNFCYANYTTCLKLINFCRRQSLTAHLLDLDNSKSQEREREPNWLINQLIPYQAKYDIPDARLHKLFQNDLICQFYLKVTTKIIFSNTYFVDHFPSQVSSLLDKEKSSLSSDKLQKTCKEYVDSLKPWLKASDELENLILRIREMKISRFTEINKVASDKEILDVLGKIEARLKLDDESIS